MADPDALADLPAILAPAPNPAGVECVDTFYIAMRAHAAATGEELPDDEFPHQYPDWTTRDGTSTSTTEPR